MGLVVAFDSEIRATFPDLANGADTGSLVVITVVMACRLSFRQNLFFNKITPNIEIVKA